MAGEDPFGSFLARRRRPVRQPAYDEPESESLSPETDAALAGTIFVDPFKDFLSKREGRALRTQDQIDAEHPVWSRIGRFASGVATPFRKFLQEGVNASSEAMPMIRAGNYPAAFERIARPVLSPFQNLQQLAATGSMQEGEELGRAAAKDPVTTGLETAGLPVGELQDAYRRRDYLDLAGQVVGNAAMMAAPHGGMKMLEPTVMSPGARARLWTDFVDRKMTPTAEDFTLGARSEYDSPLGEFEQNPNLADQRPNVAPWWNRGLLDEPPQGRLPPAPEPPGLPPADYPGLPPSGGAGGPFAPPPPRGSIEAVPPYGADVRWQHPGGGADPFAAFLESRGSAPPEAPPEAPPAPPVRGRGPKPKPGAPPAAPVSEEDMVAQALGFPDMASMRARGRQMAPPRTPTPSGELLPPSAPPPTRAGLDPLGTDPLARLLGNVSEAEAYSGEGHFDDPHVDPLTQLKNRRGWERAGAQPNRLIGRIDMDNFKHLNDTLGHEAGDKALQVVADTLREFTRRQGDEAARLGGDEFGLNLEAPQAGGDLVEFRQRIEDAIAQRLKDAGFSDVAGKQIGASLGFGDTEATADAAARLRKKERGISQPRAAAPPLQPPAAFEVPPAEPAPPTSLVPAERPRVPKADVEAEAFWPEVLNDARAQGFTGTEQELRGLFDQHVGAGRDLMGDLQNVRDEYSPSALMQAIRKLGGLSTSEDVAREMAGIREQRGAASITRKGGLPKDQLLDELHQDPRWRQLSEEELDNELQKLRHTSDDTATPVPSLVEAAHASGMRLGEKWWEVDSFDPAALEQQPPTDPLADMLDTGEVQPRLPGDVGAVREAERQQPREEVPFALTRENAETTQLQPRLTEEPSGLPEPRHDVREPGKVTKLAESMREGGWQGRPVLVVKLGNTEVAWTGTHRLAAAREAGLSPADVPMVKVDGQRLIDAGYELDDLTGKGKKKRAEALRAAGFDEAANLLDEEARVNVAEAPEAVPQHVKDFLVKRLNYTPAEVDAMGARSALELGNKVRTHPEGAGAGIKAFAKAPPAEPPSNPTPRPNLGETSARVPADELATMLGIQERRTAMQRTRLPADDIDVPRGTESSGAPAPRTTAQRQAAGEPLTVKERQELGLPPIKPEGRVATQSEAALSRSAMTENARTLAKLIENPTPENLDEYVRLMGETADRQAQREFKAGKEGEVRKNERTGEYLASGLGGLQKLYDENPALFWLAMRTAGGALIGVLTKQDDPLAGILTGAAIGAASGPLWRTLRAQAPGVASALRDTLPPKLGGKEGLPPGRQPVRAPRDLTKDISGLEQRVYGQPHRTVPDVWKEISPALDDLAEAERESPSTTPEQFQVTRNIYLSEALSSIDAAAKDANANGLYRRGRYLEAMADELRGVPTVLERGISDLTSGKVSPKQVRKTTHRVESALYLNLLGAALDTALTNRTQILLAYPQIGGENLLAGVKRARTPEGRGETKFLEIDKPSDQADLPSVPNRTLRKLADLVLSPLKASDTQNRRDVYLGSIIAARKQGLNPQQAHEWAMEITAQTQGTPGDLGNNPFHRHLGPLRMFTKYPQIWGQWLADAATHPDPGVRRRLVGYFLGFGLVGAVTGISVQNLLFPRLIPGSAALKAGGDLLSHALGTADHTMGEDANPLRGGAAAIGRYPAKVAKEMGHFAKTAKEAGSISELLGPHVDVSPEGIPRGEHSAWEGFLSLIGQKSAREADEQKALDDAYTWIADRSRQHAIEGRYSREDLARAIESGDNEAASAASRGLSREQLRSFYKRRRQDRYTQLLSRVPRIDRAEFERKFRESLSGGQ